MSNPLGGYPPSHGQQSSPSTPEVAKDEAAEVARTAAQNAGQVASTVGEQAGQVASETAHQARNLFEEGKGQLSDQARQGQQRAASGLHALADQLHGMAEKSDGDGIAPEMARQASERARTVASWLEKREPGDLLNEVRRFARRKPGVFLAGAALAGVVVGRLTRGAIAAQSEAPSPTGTPTPTPRPTTPQAPVLPPAPVAPHLDQTATPAYGVPVPERTVASSPGYSTPPATPNWEQQPGASGHQTGPVTR